MNDPLVRLLFLLHLATTLFMLGVIWFVQVVHYPIFAKTGSTEFSGYEQTHTTLTTWVVAPPMLVEAGTAMLLLWFRPARISNLQCGTGLALLGVIWLSTLFLQVPCHELLSRGFDSAVHQRLVSTNWIRTAAWSLRGLLVLWMAWSFQGEVMILEVDNERTSSTGSAGTAFPCAGSQKFAVGIHLPASWTCNCVGPTASGSTCRVSRRSMEEHTCPTWSGMLFPSCYWGAWLALEP